MTRTPWLAFAGVLALGAAAGGAVWYTTRAVPADSREAPLHVLDPWARPDLPPGPAWGAQGGQAPPARRPPDSRRGTLGGE